MRVLILGGGGFIGHRLANALLSTAALEQSVTQLVLVDLAFPVDRISDRRAVYIQGDFSDEAVLKALFRNSPDLIFHLAAIVSGEAERDFELGMKVNFHASLQILEFCRLRNVRPRIVFSSSCGVFGGDVTKIVTDETAPKPRSSYGTEKAMIELLMNDYSRRRFVDARTLRLPTIAVRHGKPNAATSSFISGIIREPLNGQHATYPVPPSSKFWIQSPRRVIENLIHAANLPEDVLGDDRIINLPGITVSVAEMIAGLERIGGKNVTQHIHYQPDEFLERIVLTWPPYFDTRRADDLGFLKDESIDEIIRSYMEELRDAGRLAR